MKLISINIEKDAHLEKIFSFIQKESPDVLCLQEVYESDLNGFENLGYSCAYQPNSFRIVGDLTKSEGVALCSKHGIHNERSWYYRNADSPLMLFDPKNVSSTIKYGLIYGDVNFEGDTFTIATTHFTWTPNGSEPSREQIDDTEKFLSYVSKIEPHVVCGDFNIPRHKNYLYDELTKIYTDQIPSTYTSSLDRTLHRAGTDSKKTILFDAYMVDYIFTQPPYRATDVRLEFGISDHAGVVATITKD